MAKDMDFIADGYVHQMLSVKYAYYYYYSN